jgi:hypothetical protein
VALAVEASTIALGREMLPRRRDYDSEADAFGCLANCNVNPEGRTMLCMRVVGVWAFIGVPAVLSAQSVSPPSRSPTCASALRDYRAASEIPGKYDTVRVSVGTVTSMETFDSLMRVEAAKAGATGMLRIDHPDPSGTVRTQFIPVFVASDTARIRAACQSGLRKPDHL